MINESVKNLSFGVHGTANYQGGIYNMLASFGVSLHKAFKNKGFDIKYTHEYLSEYRLPIISVGFNVFDYPVWDLILENNASNIMWTVDSAFFQNVDVIEKYHKNKTFSCICLSHDDDEAIKMFLPELNTNCLPLAIDPEIWHSDNIEKTKDIVFLASIKDVEAEIAEVKKALPDNVFNMYMEMYEFTMKNPHQNFWEIYSLFSSHYKFDKNNFDLYKFLFQKLCYVVSYQKRIDLVRSLSGFNLEVWGNGPWEKYISGNVKHMGSASLFDAVEIIKSAKIAINLQPMQILNGIHDRIMNSSAANTLVFTDKNKTIFDSYGDNLCYINNINFEGLTDSINYYLNNDEERKIKAKSAQEITLKHHTWENRVDELLALITLG
ncbi:MAG: glycosyltransferase [Candidatus Gastranaerophilaceae bacterium]|jgi:spore maturation protein CgeB